MRSIWTLSLFGAVGRGYTFFIPLLLFAGYGLYFVLFPEVASRRSVRRRGLENDPDAVARVHLRCRITGGITLVAVFAALVWIVISIWMDRI